MKFEFDDMLAYIEGKEPYDPPEGNTKGLDVIMAAAITVKVYDEMRRKASIMVSDAIKGAAESVDKMNEAGCEAACMELLCAIADDNPKALPVDMRTIQLITMTLVDRGKILPPRGFVKEELDKAIKMNRMILVSMAGRIAEVEDKRSKREKSSPEN